MASAAVPELQSRSVWLRILVGAAAMVAMSPLPWGAAKLGLAQPDGLGLIVVVGGLLVGGLPAARWAFGSWPAVAITGAVLNLYSLSSVLLDPAAPPFAALFLTGPYAAFTLAGIIGWFDRSRATVARWVGVLLPPAAYSVPFIVGAYLRARFGP